MLCCMRTTIDLDGELLRQAKQAAAANGVTLTRLIEDAVRAVLQKRVEQPQQGPELPVFQGRGLRPGVDLADSAGLLEVMDDASR
jgi:hypothetical protein